MAEIGEITVKVGAKLIVDKETADICLKMVELYVNNTGALIKVNCREDNTTIYEFVEQKGE